MIKKTTTVGIVGYGAFGKFCVVLIERFLPEINIKVYSRRNEPDGELFCSLAEAAACDVVLLCVSIPDYEKYVIELAPLLGEYSVLVDIATVKKHTNDLFVKHLVGKQFVCAHPMFGPESYQKSAGDVGGYRIAVTDYTLTNDGAIVLKNIFSAAGFVVIEMTADEHDQMLAETLFLTHYIGQAMSQGGFGRTNIDTVSFSYLMNAVESVINDAELFANVYAYNPYCKEVAERFHTAQQRVLQSLK